MDLNTERPLRYAAKRLKTIKLLQFTNSSENQKIIVQNMFWKSIKVAWCATEENLGSTLLARAQV